MRLITPTDIPTPRPMSLAVWFVLPEALAGSVVAAAVGIEELVVVARDVAVAVLVVMGVTDEGADVGLVVDNSMEVDPAQMLTLAT
jgi:hypothetical protein